MKYENKRDSNVGDASSKKRTSSKFTQKMKGKAMMREIFESKYTHYLDGASFQTILTLMLPSSTEMTD